MIVACGQMEANTIEQAPRVWPVVERLAAQAARARADILVLPETTYPSYWLDSAQRYMQPDIMRSADVLRRFASIARQHRFWLIAGFVEEAAGRLHNSAAVFNREGDLVGIARKSFLWDCDNRWFSPADHIAAMDSEFGRIGVLICADCRAPEITATLVADGARMLFLPTAWVNATRTPGAYSNVHPEFLVRARALEFGVPFACCSKSGREGDRLEYVGRSRIVSADGTTLCEAPITGEHLIVAPISPGSPPEFDEFDYRRILDRAPAYRAAAPGRKVSINPRLNADAVAAELERAGARIARVEICELDSFVPARRAALDGAQVVIARGRVDDDALIRARAAENRIFTIAATDTVHMIAHPTGAIIHRDSVSSGAVELDLSQADLKQFTPETDIWHQRRVESYRLPASAAVACQG